MKFPDLPRAGTPVMDTVKQIINYLRSSQVVAINGIKGTASTGGTTFTIPIGDKNEAIKNTQPPFWVNLVRNGPDNSVYLVPGYVIARDATGNCVTEYLPAALPTKDSMETIIGGYKIFCSVHEDDKGIATEAAIGIGPDWPESYAPKLKGGDNTNGTEGMRYYRIAEAIEEGDTLRIKQWMTGHIDHFQPTLTDNATPTAIPNGGRVLKEWSEDEGKWYLRYLEARAGIAMEEDNDRILIKTAGASMNLTVRWIEVTTDGYLSTNASNDVILYFADGVFVGLAPPSPDDRVNVIEQDVANIAFIS